MEKLEDKRIEYMNLPHNLTLLRLLNKLDLAYIAKYCRTTKRRVLAWEKGTAMPTLWQLECLTVLFKTSMDYICGTKQSSKLIANQAIGDKEVTVEELMLVRIYRELSKESQNIAKKIIENLFFDETEKNEEMFTELKEVLNSKDYEKLCAFVEKYSKSN